MRCGIATGADILYRMLLIAKNGGNQQAMSSNLKCDDRFFGKTDKPTRKSCFIPSEVEESSLLVHLYSKIGAKRPRDDHCFCGHYAVRADESR